MPSARRRPSAATARRVEQAAGDLGAAAVARIEQRHEWFRALPAEQRSWVGLVAQAGIASFVEWFSGDQTRVDTGTDVFGTAPSELTRSISLGQTLDLVRTTVEVVEEHTSELAGPKDADRVREAVLRYSREVAFGAAEVYAQAAESRGAWDARLESVVVDAVLRGEADQGMHSRAAALGWGSVQGVIVLVGSTPPGDGQGVVSALHRRARRVDLQVLATVQGARVVAIVGSVTDPLEAARSLADCFGPGPLVAGPRVPHLFAAGRSAARLSRGMPRHRPGRTLLDRSLPTTCSPSGLSWATNRRAVPCSSASTAPCGMRPTSWKPRRLTSSEGRASKAARAPSSCTRTRSAIASGRSPSSSGTT